MDVLISVVGLFVVFSLLAWFASRAKHVDVKPKTQFAKPASQATVKPRPTVKPKAPTEEELMAMSDRELLRKIAMHSERTDNHLSHIRVLICLIILGFLALLSP